jgi:hypothetical protein
MQPPNKEEAWVDPTWERLEDQIAWYEARRLPVSGRSERCRPTPNSLASPASCCTIRFHDVSSLVGPICDPAVTPRELLVDGDPDAAGGRQGEGARTAADVCLELDLPPKTPNRRHLRMKICSRLCEAFGGQAVDLAEVYGTEV